MILDCQYIFNIKCFPKIDKKGSSYVVGYITTLSYLCVKSYIKLQVKINIYRSIIVKT